HATAISLNPSPSAGTLGTPLALRAQLVDISVTPNAPIAGATVSLALGASSCSGVTDAQGFAACAVTAGTPGNLVLSAVFAGNATHAASSASAQATILAGLSSLAAAPASVHFGTVG